MGEDILEKVEEVILGEESTDVFPKVPHFLKAVQENRQILSFLSFYQIMRADGPDFVNKSDFWVDIGEGDCIDRNKEE